MISPLSEFSSHWMNYVHIMRGPTRRHMAGDSVDNPPRKMFLKYFLSCVSGVLAETVVYPLDVGRTHLQLQQRNGVATLGVLRHTVALAKNQGVRTVWNGLHVANMKHYTGLRIGVYELMRREFYPYVGRDIKQAFPLKESLLCSFTAGALAQFAATPTDHVKEKLQLYGFKEGQNTPVFRNSHEAFSFLYRKRGFRGLWLGCVPKMQRASILTMADLTTYDMMKHLMRQADLEEGPVVHTVSAVVAGLVAASLATPLDFLKSKAVRQLKMYADNPGQPREYFGFMHCLYKTIRTEGISALYKGYAPVFVRMVPNTVVFWIFFENLRLLCGVEPL